MKYYKVKNTEIAQARHVYPIECLWGDGEYSFYLSARDEVLEFPFVEMTEEEMRQVQETQAQKIENLESKEQEVQNALANFSSNALGKRGIYDSDLVQQANLLQILSLGKGGKLRVKCDGEEKQYIFHTKEQVKQVMSDWVKHKDKILSEFEEFKRGI